MITRRALLSLLSAAPALLAWRRAPAQPQSQLRKVIEAEKARWKFYQHGISAQSQDPYPHMWDEIRYHAERITEAETQALLLDLDRI